MASFVLFCFVTGGQFVYMTVQVGRSLDEGLYEFMEHGRSGGVGV